MTQSIGESRCFAFAKFISLEHSKQFIENNYPFLYIGNHRVRISYSKENKWDDDGWICYSVWKDIETGWKFTRVVVWN